MRRVARQKAGATHNDLGERMDDDESADGVTSIVAAMDVPLDGPIYDGVHAHLSLEVRDFGEPSRTLVVRMWVEGTVQTAMVDWESFTGAFDAMRAGMMPADWDGALSALRALDEPGSGNNN